jgi:methionine-S-sulfoxide reductase
MNDSIVLGGGCFWCIEAVFQIIDGVSSVTSGYAGGVTPNPTYEQVCSGTSGYIEVVKVEFNTTITPLSKILDIFFKVHDPTSMDRQGNDIGSQYRSAIFANNSNQFTEIEKYINAVITSKKYSKPIVTEIRNLDMFYPAEAYHQNYFRRHPDQGYCQVVITPKISKVIEETAV